MKRKKSCFEVDHVIYNDDSHVFMLLASPPNIDGPLSTSTLPRVKLHTHSAFEFAPFAGL